MNSKKVFFIMLGFIVILSGVGVFSIVYGTKTLQKKSAQLTELKIQDKLIDEQKLSLIQANKDIEKYKELEDISKSIVPQDKDQAKTVREIIKIADETGIKINTINFPPSTLGQKVPTTKTTDTKSTVKTPPITQVKTVDGIPGLYQLEVTVGAQEVSSTYNQLVDFLNKLEQNRRTAQVTSIKIQPSKTNRGRVEFQLTMNVFVKP